MNLKVKAFESQQVSILACEIFDADQLPTGTQGMSLHLPFNLINFCHQDLVGQLESTQGELQSLRESTETILVCVSVLPSQPHVCN